jgi:uncharacterized membrane protein
MANPSSDEIVRLAQQRIAERQNQERKQVQSERQQQVRGSTSWRWAFAGLIATLLIALLLWPGTPLNWKMYAVVHGVCAQIHNVELGGVQLPLCARNTGIYAGFLNTLIFLAILGRGRAGKLPPIGVTIVLGLFVLIMAVDGFNSMLRDMFLPHLYVPFNALRTLTGLGMGISLGVMLLLIINLALRSDVQRNQRVLNGWGELAAAVGANLLIWAAIYGNVGVFYWPIAIVAWTGIVGILFCVNLLVAAIIMQYENAVSNLRDLAKPGTVALILTGIELGLLSWARFWLEGRGLIV